MRPADFGAGQGIEFLARNSGQVPHGAGISNSMGGLCNYFLFQAGQDGFKRNRDTRFLKEPLQILRQMAQGINLTRGQKVYLDKNTEVRHKFNGPVLSQADITKMQIFSVLLPVLIPKRVEPDGTGNRLNGNLFQKRFHREPVLPRNFLQIFFCNIHVGLSLGAKVHKPFTFLIGKTRDGKRLCLILELPAIHGN